jgi:signal transduction histidine kinase
MSREHAVTPRSDEAAVRRASRRVAVQFGLAVVIVAVLGLAGAFVFVLRRVPDQLRVFPFRDLSMTLGARDFLLAGIAGATIAVVVAAAMALILTRRAVRPLAEALRLQRDFVADASHELRTPLAVLDMRVQLLERENGIPEDAREELAELRRDADRLNAVIADLLEAADLSAVAASADQQTDAVQAARAAAEEMRAIAADRSVTIRVAGSGSLWVQVPAERLRRCLVILLDNAIRHSPAGSQIDVTVGFRRRQVRITVIDHGSGIAGIDPSRIFDRFAHSRPRENADAAGHGIGLALVKDAAVRYGGSVRLVRTSAAGTELELRFPRIAARSVTP